MGDRRGTTRAESRARLARWFPASDDRGLSVPTNYVIMLAIVAILASGLFVASSGYVRGQQDQAVRAGLEVAGNRLANDLAAADRLAGATTAPGDLSVSVDLPERVAGSTYTVAIDTAGTTATITLTSAQPEATVTVAVQTNHPVAATSVSGGALVIRYDPAAGSTLEVSHA